MMTKVRCPNLSCGKTSLFHDDGLRRIFRCSHCQTKLPSADSFSRGRDVGAFTGLAQWSGKISSVQTLVGELPITVAEDALPAPAQAANSGQTFRLGRLQIRDKLGSGSFATIYHAFDPLLERDLTLKVFHTAEGGSSKDLDHFLTEIKALARLRHPHIVPIYDAGREGEYHYIAMAFIEGCTLAEAVSNGPFDWRHSARVIGEIAEALAYAHGLGIVHRDVKPSNIVLGARGVAHLIDFGLAHRPGTAGELNREGAIRGTPAYLAPEQARGNDAIPQPVNDQYSLGAVLYELLCGRPPFSGPPLKVLVSAVQLEPPRPRDLNPAVPPGLEAICLKTLAKRPEDRYPSCQLLAEDLQSSLRGGSILAVPPTSRGWAVRSYRHMRRFAATLLAVLTLLFLTLRPGILSGSI